MPHEDGPVPASRWAPGRFISAARTAAIVAACLLLAAPVAGRLFGYRALVVAGGSMEPYASVGDVFVLQEEPADVGPGDIVTFVPLRGSRLVTHRILERVSVAGEPHFQTQGDGNATPDADLAPAANVVGRVVASVPNLGAFYAFATGTTGRVVLVVIPALALAWRELRELRPRRPRSRRLRSRRHAVTALLVIGAVLGGAGPAAGFFVATRTVSANAFATGAVQAPVLNSATGGSGVLSCRATLAWSAPAAGVAPDGYDVYRSTTSGGPYTFVAHVGAVTSYVDNGLAANTTYHYVLRSSRASWRSANSNQRSATTPLLCVV